MKKEILESVISFDNKINVEELKKEVLSKDFIIDEIKRLNLNDYQIKKGMGILQRYHDYVIENNSKPSYKLFVDIYGFLAEDYSADSMFQKSRIIDNFWLTSITSLDPNIQSYFDNYSSSSMNDTKVFSQSKSNIKNYINSLIKTKESLGIKETLENAFKSPEFSYNIWLYDNSMSVGNDILKYIAAMNGISFDKSVAFISANDLFNYLSSNAEEKKSIELYLNKVDVLLISNLSLGLKPQWFFDYLINIFATRKSKTLTTVISSSRDITNKKTKLLTSYYYSKDQKNDLEELFRNLIINNFKKIIIN